MLKKTDIEEIVLNIFETELTNVDIADTEDGVTIRVLKKVDGQQPYTLISAKVRSAEDLKYLFDNFGKYAPFNRFAPDQKSVFPYKIEDLSRSSIKFILNFIGQPLLTPKGFSDYDNPAEDYIFSCWKDNGIPIGGLNSILAKVGDYVIKKAEGDVLVLNEEKFRLLYEAKNVHYGQYQLRKYISDEDYERLIEGKYV